MVLAVVRAHPHRHEITMQSKLSTILLICVVATPWFVGGNLPLVKTVLLSVFSVINFLLLFNQNSLTSGSKIETTLKGILLAGVAYTGFQLVPWSTATLTTSPSATREFLVDLILAANVFFAACALLNTRQMFHRLCLWLTFNGALLALFGLLQIASKSTHEVLWTYETTFGQPTFSAFACQNNAGGYLCMCLAAASFLLAISFRRSDANQSFSLDERLRSSPRRLLIWFSEIDTLSWYLMFSGALIAAGICGTLSRGAMLAFAASVAVGTLLLVRRSWIGGFAVVLALGMGGYLLYNLEQGDAAIVELGTLQEWEENSGYRFEHWQDTLKYAWNRPVFGTGAGTHKFMYLSMQEVSHQRWFIHAENSFLELWVDSGFVGLGLALLFLLTTVFLCFRLVLSKTTTSFGAGLVGLMCLSSQLVSNFFDFGIYQPANFLLFTTIVGGVCGCYRSVLIKEQSRLGEPRGHFLTTKWTTRTVLARVVIGSLSAVAIWATYESSAIEVRRIVQRSVRKFDPDKSSMKDVQKNQRLIDYSLAIRPDDGLAHFESGKNHVLAYRVATREEFFREAKEEEALPARADVWKLTSLNHFHRTFRILERNDPESLRQFVESAPVQTHLSNAWESFSKSYQHQKQMWQPPLKLAKLACLFGAEGDEVKFINTTLANAPLNINSLFEAGLLGHDSGNSQLATRYWRDCLMVGQNFQRRTRRFEKQIIELCRKEVGLKTFIEDVIPPDPELLVRLIRTYFQEDKYFSARVLLANRARKSLATIPNDKLGGSQRNFLAAELENAATNYSLASEYYAQSLKSTPDNVKVRIAYGKNLILEKNYDEAVLQFLKVKVSTGSKQIEKLLKKAKRLRDRNRSQQ